MGCQFRFRLRSKVDQTLGQVGMLSMTQSARSIDQMTLLQLTPRKVGYVATES